MRGIDYRSERVPMCLVIAQSFSCTREALQGVARVGRFGDPCKKVRFSDVPELVDKRQLQYTSKLMRYVAELKKKVVVKQVKMKETVGQPQRAYTSARTNLAKRQVEALNPNNLRLAATLNSETAQG